MKDTLDLWPLKIDKAIWDSWRLAGLGLCAVYLLNIILRKRLFAFNARNWPGGVAISLYTLIVHWLFSSESSSHVGGAEKHEIYVAAFGGHLFYDLFLRGGGMAPLAPWIRYFFCYAPLICAL